MSRIEVFADIVCPFTHVGLRRLSEARRGRERRRWYVCERGRSSGSTALRCTQISSPTRSPPARAGRARLVRRLRSGDVPRTSIPAFGLAAAAYAVDDLTGEVVSLAFRDALFERGQDVSDDDVLHTIGQPFGIEPLDRTVAESAIRTDWERGKARDVQGSPHFFVGDRGLVLSQPGHQPRRSTIRRPCRRRDDARLLRRRVQLNTDTASRRARRHRTPRRTR